jgi:ABC-type glutathione transport system ATPase component
VDDLSVAYGTRRDRHPTPVVHNVSFAVEEHRTLGLVGESGSGKSTIGRAILGLANPVGGTIRFAGRDITRLSRRDRRPLARDIQVIFQDPYSSLNPAMQIQDILAEPLIAQGRSSRDARAHIRGLLDAVHLPSDAARRLPSEFSGGQRQRIAIARSLATEPRLIVCDEPVSGLDLKTQAHVLDLLLELQQRTGVAYLFVSHDLSVIRRISHDVVVLLKGRIVEAGPVAEVTTNPRHDYVKRLFMSSPVADPDDQARRRAALRAMPPIAWRDEAEAVGIEPTPAGV